MRETLVKLIFVDYKISRYLNYQILRNQKRVLEKHKSIFKKFKYIVYLRELYKKRCLAAYSFSVNNDFGFVRK